MTGRALTPLERIATLIALETPKRRSPHCPSCYVAWDHIDAIRAELERLGIDWRAMHAETKRLQEERREVLRDARADHRKELEP